MAHMRQTNSASVGPVLGPYRTFGRPPATSQFDPTRTCWRIPRPTTAITLTDFSVTAYCFRLASPARLLADKRDEHGRTIPLPDLMDNPFWTNSRGPAKPETAQRLWEEHINALKRFFTSGEFRLS
jgi:hypothetical protein